MTTSSVVIPLSLSGCEATIYTRDPATYKPPQCWVILLGFMGASSRNMERLATVVLSVLGPHVRVQILAATAPVSFVLRQGMQESWEDGPYAAFAEDIVHLTQEEEGREGGEEKATPILLHSASQNGCFAYRALVGRRTKRPIRDHARWRQRIAGAVFDSSPVALSPAAVDEAVGSALGPVRGALVTAALRLAIGGQRQYSQRMARQKDVYTEWFLEHDPISAPLLFLFSLTDRISSSEYIHALLAERRRGGNEVHWHDFGGSSHGACTWGRCVFNLRTSFSYISMSTIKLTPSNPISHLCARTSPLLQCSILAPSLQSTAWSCCSTWVQSRLFGAL